MSVVYSDSRRCRLSFSPRESGPHSGSPARIPGVRPAFRESGMDRTPFVALLIIAMVVAFCLLVNHVWARLACSPLMSCF